MDGSYHIGNDYIRTLALTCHALDAQFDQLFNFESICEISDELYEIHQRLLSTSLLNLAIAIRVSLRNEREYSRKDTGISAAGFFESTNPKIDGRFSIKDICDKLIHADEIHKPIEPGVRGACCTLIGTLSRHSWEFDLGIQIFCEYVLKWLDEIDERRANG